MPLALALGDSVPIAGQEWVVGAVTATSAGEIYAVQLYGVPAGKTAAERGTTWEITDPGIETAGFSVHVPLTTTVSLPPPVVPVP